MNSLVVAVGATILTLLLGFPAAYGLSRYPIWKKEAVVFDILSLKMIPPVAAAVPIFLLSQKTGLYNTLLLLILLNAAFQLPFVILVMKSFLDDIPREIDEAAQIDGCGPIGTLVRAILPISVPGLICCTLFVFIFTWNEFLFANIMVGGDLRPLPVVVGLSLTHRGILWGPALALGLVIILPVLALSVSLARYMTRGLTFGAVKG
jgi:multiple sugar transport system permease protein